MSYECTLLERSSFMSQKMLLPVDIWAIIQLIQRASQVALVVKNPPANAGDTRDMGSTLGWGRSPGKGNGTPLQHFCLENSMDKRGWQAAINGIGKESGVTVGLSIWVFNSAFHGFSWLISFYCWIIFHFSYIQIYHSLSIYLLMSSLVASSWQL